MGGCSLVMKHFMPSCKVIVAEPSGADDFAKSIAAGSRVKLESVNTIADGLRTLSVGETNWPILQRYVDEVAVVSDQQIVEAMKWLYFEMGIVVEPSGAASVAAAFRNLPRESAATAVCVISGGNVDPIDFQNYLAQ